ncbi:tetratricopeptide repeat protein [Bacteroidota bacterium]
MQRRIILLALPAAFLISACSGDDDQKTAPEQLPATVEFLNVSGGVAYVGDDACASCHEDEYATFQNHGMARSMERLTEDLIRPEFPSPVLHHEPTNLSYRAFKDGDKYYQEEFRLSSDGTKTHSLTREMMWVIGSGTIARTYINVENGRYTEMPLTWYTQRNTWDFSPNYQVSNLRFDRALPDRCVACHNAYPTSVPYVSGAFEPLAEGVSCERCHGPGELHVNERLANPEPASAIDPTIVNSKYLPLDAGLDVCQQCHVSATVSILREGRTPFQFVPTEALESHVALFSEVLQASRQISLASHANRMKRSACFQALMETDSPMTCVTCHDPHESLRDSGPAHFNAACEGCHDQEQLLDRVLPAAAVDHESGTNCVSCHMPKEDVWYIPHSAATDHWVRVVGRSGGRQSRRQPTGSSLDELELGSLEPYFEIDRSSPDADVYLGVAYIVFAGQYNDPRQLERGIEILEGALTDASRFGDAHFQLGFALYSVGRLQDAEEPLETSVRLGPDIPERLNALAQLYEHLDRSPDRISELYQHALQIQPLSAPIRVNYGRFLETQSREAEALQQYETALDHRPSLATGHYNLGTLLIRQGDFVRGEQHLVTAIELDPDYTEAHSNLGVLLASQDRKDEARRVFEQAVEVAPDDPIALNNLASLYLNEGMDARAVPLLKKAVNAQPSYVDALANLALASLRVGADGEASAYAARALALDPDNVLANEITKALQ